MVGYLQRPFCVPQKANIFKIGLPTLRPTYAIMIYYYRSRNFHLNPHMPFLKVPPREPLRPP